MYESRIAADHLTVAAIAGLAPEIDALAARAVPGRRFLRRAWYGAGRSAAARSLVLRGGDGAALAVIPTVPFGPAIAGARKVPGSYWPLRAALVAHDCTAAALAHALDDPAAARSLGPVWRVGPARRDDPAIVMMLDAAQQAGWTVLARPAGTSWVVNCAVARASGWPRPSTAKRFARLERRLARLGTAQWKIVRGPGWNDGVLEALATVEAASWIATKTNGSGAKFMVPQQRAAWRSVLADPVLAEMLCATILTIDGKAAAFSFDLDDGPVRYGIAGTYRSDFAKAEVGKLANYRALADAIVAGQDVVDLGAGDSGYKRELGAVPGYALDDYLFVRSTAAARVMARIWGAAVTRG